MKPNIILFEEADRDELVELWEASVRATHLFLSEDDIRLIKNYVFVMDFAAVPVYCCKTQDNRMIGFFGVENQKLEMLFLHPRYFGKDYGLMLLNYATESLGATRLDVNEQNEPAVRFYLKNGFEVIKRNPLDAMGNPFPVLEMYLMKSTSVF